MKRLRSGDPSIHTSLKLILAVKNKDYLISYISATKYVQPETKSYNLLQNVVSHPRSHAQETELQSWARPSYH